MCPSQTVELFSELELPVRNYRRPMKPILRRKATSSARINLNKFWNDLEEFYDSWSERNVNDESIRTTIERLPEYTADAFNQERESAENDLNEMLERSSCSSYSSYSSNFDCESTFSCDDDDFDSGNEDCHHFFKFLKSSK
jgi:hypothetical protein